MACFKKQTFDFPIEANKVVGGTYRATAKVIYGESVNLEAAASTGYHFDADWMRSDNSGESYEKLHGVSSSFSNITTATRIYPVFIENQYNVTFNANGGAGDQMKDQQFDYSKLKALSANVYTKNGYSFTGWNTLPSPTDQAPGEHFEDGQEVSRLAADNNQSVTLYAQWELANYTITCNLAGGSFPAGTKILFSYNIDSSDIVIPVPTRSNYTFVGWTSDDFDGMKYDIVIPSGSAGNKEYTANWEGNAAEIQFHPGDHGQINRDGVRLSYARVSLKCGDAMPAFNPLDPMIINDGASNLTYSLSADAGYVFNGWEDAQGNPPGTEVAGSAAYTAQWVPADNIHYTVNYIKLVNQGGMYTAVQTETAQNTVGTTGAEVSVTPIVYEGYHFVSKVSNDIVSNTSGTIKGDGTLVLSLYYIPNQYTVQLNANGGYNTSPQGSASVNVNYTYGGNKSLASFWFARTGYTISGWTANADGTGDRYPVDQDIPDLTAVDGGSVILYAQWQPISYKVTFSSNHDTPAVTEQTMTYGVSAKLPENMYTRPGYHFTGWSRQSSDTTDLQQPGTEVINLTEQANSTVSFYAQWAENADIMITYAAGAGGTVSRTEEAIPPSSGHPAGSDASALPGYEFVNWTDQDSKVVSETTYVQPARINDIYLANTYTAHFRPIVYNIDYSYPGNNVTIGNNPSTYTVETPDITLADASRPGYEFTGWTLGDQVNSVKGLVIPKGTIGNLTVTANFSPIRYSITYNLNEGSLKVAEPSTYTTDRRAPLPVPTRDGYDFLGWKYSGSETLIQDRAIPSGSTGNKVLDAVWEAQGSSFRFYTNGGTLVNFIVGKTDDIVADTAMPTTAKDGYFFEGWYDNSVFRGSRISSLPAKFPVYGIAYYAKWLEAFNKQPVDSTIMEDQTASFQISSSVESVSYQWQYRESAAAEWKNVTAGTGGNTAVYTTAAAVTAMSGYQYRCAAARSGETVYSSAVSLTVLPKANVGMSLTPDKSEIVYGESVTYTLEIQNTDPSLTYTLDGSVIFYQGTPGTGTEISRSSNLDHPSVTLTPAAGSLQVTAVYSGNPYFNAGTASSSVSVAQKVLTPTISGSTEKRYDGSADAPNLSIHLDGIVGSDDVTASASYSYSSRNVSSDNQITASNIQLAGEKKDNYALSAAEVSITGRITPVPVKVSGITAADKTYDGTAAAALDFTNAAFNGLLPGDSLSVTAAGAFADQNAGTGKTVNITGLTLGGTSAGNYMLADSGSQASTTADITKASLHVDADAKTKAYGEADPALTYQVSGWAEGEPKESRALSGQLEREAGEVPGTYAIQIGTLSAGGNYSITYTDAALIIRKAPVNLNVTFSQSSIKIGGSARVIVSAVTGASGKKLTAYDLPTRVSLTGPDQKAVALTSRGDGIYYADINVPADAKPAAWTYTAACAGDGNYEAAANAYGTLTVTDKNEVQMNLSADKTQGIVYGDSVTYTASVRKASFLSFEKLDGTITFYRGTEKIGESTNLEYAQVTQQFTPGTYLIRAVYSGNPDFSSSEVAMTVTADKAVPAVSITAVTAGSTGSRTATLTASLTGLTGKDAPTGDLTLAIRDSAGAQVYTQSMHQSESYDFSLKDDVYTAEISYAGDGNYQGTKSAISFNTAKKTQEALTIQPVGAKTYGDASFQLSTAGGSGNGAVTFTSSDPSVLSISGSTAAILKAGTVRITADKAEDAGFNAAAAGITLTIARRQLTWDTSDLSAVKSADGNTNATVSGTLKISGEIKTGDAGFKYTDLTGTYDSAEAGTRTVTAAYKAAGLSDNYVLPAAAPVFTGTINKVVSLTVPSEVSDPSKYQLVQEVGISEVPVALKDNPDLNTPAKIEARMKVAVDQVDTAIPTANIEVYDVRLLFSEDGGRTWTAATKENFPAQGITAVLPYPEGTNPADFNFVITHMFTTGEKAGTTENLSYTKTADGLQVKVMSLSPFAIGYVELPAVPSANAAASPAAEKPDLWCITYLDCKGNTVSVQWVETGKAPVKPAGYSYPDIANVSAHQDVHPTACGDDTDFKVPNTADKSPTIRISELWLMLIGILLTAGVLAHLRKRKD